MCREAPKPPRERIRERRAAAARAICGFKRIRYGPYTAHVRVTGQTVMCRIYRLFSA